MCQSLAAFGSDDAHRSAIDKPSGALRLKPDAFGRGGDPTLATRSTYSACRHRQDHASG